MNWEVTDGNIIQTRKSRDPWITWVVTFGRMRSLECPSGAEDSWLGLRKRKCKKQAPPECSRGKTARQAAQLAGRALALSPGSGGTGTSCGRAHLSSCWAISPDPSSLSPKPRVWCNTHRQIPGAPQLACLPNRWAPGLRGKALSQNKVESDQETVQWLKALASLLEDPS